MSDYSGVLGDGVLGNFTLGDDFSGTFGFGQAKLYIQPYKFAQAQLDIKVTKNSFSQATLFVTTLVLVQQAYATDGGAGYTVSLPGAITPGNLLFCVIGSTDGFPPINPAQNGGLSLTKITDHYAHSSFGGRGEIYYRNLQTGDPNYITWGGFGSSATFLFEFSGLNLNSGPSDVQSSSGNNSTTLSLGFSKPWLYVNLVGFITRLEPTAIFSPNADTHQLETIGYTQSHDSILAGYSYDTSNVGGTQGGSTRDGYWWGGSGASWALMFSPAGYAQAQLVVLPQKTVQGQAQLYIQPYQFSQAQLDTKVTTNTFAQAQLDTTQTYVGNAQAQLLVYLANHLRPIADITTDSIVGVVV